MKKKIAIIYLIISTIVIVLLGVSMFLLTPNNDISYFENKESSTLNQLLFDSLNLDISNLSADVTIDEEKLNKLIAATNTIKDFRAKIDGDKVVVYKKTMIIGIIESQYAVTFDIKEDQGKLAVELDKAYIGKIKLSNSSVMKALKENEKESFTVDEDNNKMLLKMNSIDIKDAKIENNAIKMKVESNNYIKKGLDFIKGIFNK